MSFDDLLIHTVDVYRQSEGKKDRFGQPIPGQPWKRYPCRLTAAKGGETMVDKSRDVIEVQHELFLEPGADLRESDTVTVADLSGQTLVEDADVVLVRAAYDRSGADHHVEAFLSTKRGPVGA